MIENDNEDQIERLNSRVAELLRERDDLVKALRELVDYGGTVTEWDDARKYAKQVLSRVGKAPHPVEKIEGGAS